MRSNDRRTDQLRKLGICANEETESVSKPNVRIGARFHENRISHQLKAAALSLSLCLLEYSTKRSTLKLVQRNGGNQYSYRPSIEIVSVFGS